MDPEDQSNEPAGTTDTSAANPVGALDLDKFRNELLGAVNESFDTRFKGFQKMLTKRDQQIAELETKVQQANRSTLTEEEQTALDVSEKDAQIARLQMALELRELEKEFPDVAPHYERILEADSPRAQMEILKEVLTPKAPESEQPANAPEPTNRSSVDPNSPADTGLDGLAYEEAFEKDPSLLDRILKGAPRLRGLDE